MRSTLLIMFAVALSCAACGGGKGGGGNNTPPPPMEVLDQSVIPNPPDAMFPIGDVDCAQSLRTATAGKLTRVELLLSAPAMSMGMLRIDVRPALAGVPDVDDNNAFGFVDVDVASLPLVPTFLPFDLSAFNINITASQSIAIVARRIAGTGTVATIHGVNMDVYGNGQAARRGGMVWGPQATVDFGFKTYVLP